MTEHLHITTPVPISGDVEVEPSLRPHRLAEFIGQGKVREALSIAIEAAGGVEEHAVEPLEAPYFDLPMIEDLVAATGEDRQPHCDGHTGFVVQAVADAARRSARTGERVSVETL